MAQIAALFEAFDNLDDIDPQAVAFWIKPVPDVHKIENYLANKILYPQTLAQAPYEMQIDLAILREALRMNAPSEENALLGGNPFLNRTLRKVLIPMKFLDFVPNLSTLAYIFIDAFFQNSKAGKDVFEDLWSVVLTDDADETVGTIILPEVEEGAVAFVAVQGKTYRIRQGESANIPCMRERCQISYRVSQGKILGKTESAVEVAGGKLGLIIDARRK